MKRLYALPLHVMFAGAVLLFAVGCGEQSTGPAEQAGKTIDGAIQKGTESVSEAVEKTGEALNEAAEDATDAVSETLENTKGAIQDAGHSASEAVGLKD